jgi:hypothetical protein
VKEGIAARAAQSRGVEEVMALRTSEKSYSFEETLLSL